MSTLEKKEVKFQIALCVGDDLIIQWAPKDATKANGKISTLLTLLRDAEVFDQDLTIQVIPVETAEVEKRSRGFADIGGGKA